MRTGNPGHLKTFDYTGLRRYFLTFCTFERRRLLTQRDRVDVVRAQIARTCCEETFAILAYCFMPDHLHLLVEAQTDVADCRRFIARLKQYSGFYFKKTFGQPLWQRYGFERILRNDESTLSVARYIIDNPVRARLVASPLDFPFLGSDVYPLKEIVEAVQMSPDWKRSA